MVSAVYAMTGTDIDVKVIEAVDVINTNNAMNLEGEYQAAGRGTRKVKNVGIFASVLSSDGILEQLPEEKEEQFKSIMDEISAEQAEARAAARKAAQEK